MGQSTPVGVPATNEVIFSLNDGEVVASWPDGRPSVNLGDHTSVMAMMTDYITQTKVADRLFRASCSNVR